MVSRGSGEAMPHDVTLRGPPAVQLANQGPQRRGRGAACNGRTRAALEGSGLQADPSFSGRAGSFAPHLVP